MAEWQPIETAPNNCAILIAYDDGSIDLITEDENDYAWALYSGAEEGVIKPTHWQPLPDPPS